MTKIPYARPSITPLEVSYATDAAANGWGEKCNDYILRFERELAKFVGTEHALATSSCTGALHIALAALGVGPGDEVILADINWIATAAPIKYLGATPVLVDVLEDSWCIDPSCVEKSITSRTKAIIATHLYGNLCEIDQLLAISHRTGIPLVEDAAEAIGSRYGNQHAGTFGAFGVFSFHGSKTITTGEGGALVTSDPVLYEKIKTLANHGRKTGELRQFWPTDVGFKYKMSNLQAAIGCAQLERAAQLIDDKRRVFFEYQRRLSQLPVKMNPEKTGTQNGYWMPTVIVDDSVHFDRDAAIASMRALGIDARIFFWPLSMLPMALGVGPVGVSSKIFFRGLNLPSYYGMTMEEIETVSESLYRSLS